MRDRGCRSGSRLPISCPSATIPCTTCTICSAVSSSCAETAAQWVVKGRGSPARVTVSAAGETGGPVLARGRQGHIQQVVMNLVQNAIDAMGPAAEAPVELSLERGAAGVALEVADRGPGIPEEFRRRVFQHFAQAEAGDTRSKGGTGLGLAISKQLVEHMGGRIGFESASGPGTSFWLWLPRHPDTRKDG